MDNELNLEELELDELDDRLEERRLDWLLEELLTLLDAFLSGALMSTTLLVRREEELEEDETEEDMLERELLERELRERELLLELEEVDVLFFRPGTRIFLSFIRTFLSSIISSSSLM